MLVNAINGNNRIHLNQIHLRLTISTPTIIHNERFDSNKPEIEKLNKKPNTHRRHKNQTWQPGLLQGLAEMLRCSLLYLKIIDLLEYTVLSLLPFSLFLSSSPVCTESKCFYDSWTSWVHNQTAFMPFMWWYTNHFLQLNAAESPYMRHCQDLNRFCAICMCVCVAFLCLLCDCAFIPAIFRIFDFCTTCCISSLAFGCCRSLAEQHRITAVLFQVFEPSQHCVIVTYRKWLRQKSFSSFLLLRLFLLVPLARRSVQLCGWVFVKWPTFTLHSFRFSDHTTAAALRKMQKMYWFIIVCSGNMCSNWRHLFAHVCINVCGGAYTIFLLNWWFQVWSV